MPTNTGTTTGGIQTTTSSIWCDTGLKVIDAPVIKIEMLPLSGSMFNDVNSSNKHTVIAYGVITCLTASTVDLLSSDLDTGHGCEEYAYNASTNDPGHGYGSKHNKFKFKINDAANDDLDGGSNSNGPMLRSNFTYCINPSSSSASSLVPRMGPAYYQGRAEGAIFSKQNSIQNVLLGSIEDRVYIFAAVKRCSFASAGAGAVDDFRLRFKLRASIDKIPKKTIPGQD